MLSPPKGRAGGERERFGGGGGLSGLSDAWLGKKPLRKAALLCRVGGLARSATVGKSPCGLSFKRCPGGKALDAGLC